MEDQEPAKYQPAGQMLFVLEKHMATVKVSQERTTLNDEVDMIA
jgi:hypothetical protein